MVYEATDVPPYTQFWIVAGFPKGVVKFTWTARRVGAFVVPKVGFVLPILVLPGHAADLAQARPRRSGQDLRQAT